jgi:hypothetical protein
MKARFEMQGFCRYRPDARLDRLDRLAAREASGRFHFFPLDSHFFSAYYFAPLRQNLPTESRLLLHAVHLPSCGISFLTGWRGK